MRRRFFSLLFRGFPIPAFLTARAEVEKRLIDGSVLFYSSQCLFSVKSDCFIFRNIALTILSIMINGSVFICLHIPILNKFEITSVYSKKQKNNSRLFELPKFYKLFLSN
jgi:hypothetical protein